jgi:hypothetical protein
LFQDGFKLANVEELHEDRHGPAVWNMEAMLLVLESSQRKDNLAISLP